MDLSFHSASFSTCEAGAATPDPRAHSMSGYAQHLLLWYSWTPALHHMEDITRRASSEFLLSPNRIPASALSSLKRSTSSFAFDRGSTV